MYEERLEKDLLNGYVAKVDPDTEDILKQRTLIRLLLSYLTIQ